MILNIFVFDQIKTHNEWIVYIPIIIFFATQFISWIGSKFKQHKETIAYKRWVLIWTERSIPEIQNQINYLNEYLNSEKENTNLNTSLLTLAPIYIKKIIESSTKDNINHFVIKTIGNEDANSEYIYNLIINLNNVQLITDEIKSRHLIHNEHINKLTLEWNKNFINFNKLINNHIIDIYKNNNKYIPYQIEISKLLNNWNDKDKKQKENMLIIENAFLKMLLKKTIAISNADLNNFYAQEIRTMINFDFLVILEQWKKLKAQNNLWFENKKGELEFSLKNISLLLEKLRLTRCKPIYIYYYYISLNRISIIWNTPKGKYKQYFIKKKK